MKVDFDFIIGTIMVLSGVTYIFNQDYGTLIASFGLLYFEIKNVLREPVKK